MSATLGNQDTIDKHLLQDQQGSEMNSDVSTGSDIKNDAEKFLRYKKV